LSIGKFSKESYLVFKKRNCLIVYKKIPRKMVGIATLGRRGIVFTT
jgi:hypothetical protein